MRTVSYEKLMRIITLYKTFPKETLRRIIKQWNFEASIEDKKTVERHIAITKITNGELTALDKFIYKNRAATAKTSLNLRFKILLKNFKKLILKYY